MKENHQPTIIMLKGPDRVRKRPSVIFGSDDIYGSITAVKTLIKLFVTEAAQGFSRGINITIHTDNSITIHSLDKGLIIDDTLVEQKPAWHYLFCDFYCAPSQPDDNYYLSLEKRCADLFSKAPKTTPKFPAEFAYDFDLCCVQYASEFMHVEATRDGVKKSLDFKCGYSVSNLVKENSQEDSSTLIKFKLDDTVFTDINIPRSTLSSYLQEIAISIPGLTCCFTDERSNGFAVYRYPLGAADYITETASLSTPLFTNEIQSTGKDRYNKKEYDARAKISLGFVENSGNIFCLHNYNKLVAGYHLNAVKEKIIRFINYELSGELNFEDIAKNIVLVLETNCSLGASVYENATKSILTNKMLIDMSVDLIGSDFSYFIKQHRNSILEIVKK